MFLFKALNRVKEITYESVNTLQHFDQIQAFHRHKARFVEHYMRLRTMALGDFVLPQWTAWNQALEGVFLPKPPLHFLKNPIIANTMFMNAGHSMMQTQLAFLEQRMSEEDLLSVLHEDAIGAPRLRCAKYRTSHNSIHHLYHYQRFLEATSYQQKSAQTIVEWGGGYGNLAKLLYRFYPAGLTYIIIDTPLFSCVQELYLTSVLPGAPEVILHTEAGKIVPGAINLVPLGHLQKMNIEGDVFISTWALSESPLEAQQYVAAQNFFNASHMVLAFQRSNDSFPAASDVPGLLKEKGAQISEIAHQAGNFYAFV